jgi:hypothetical protein
MFTHQTVNRTKDKETVHELRKRLGLFSFQLGETPFLNAASNALAPQLGIRAGGVVEWLVARDGSGAMTAGFQIVSRSFASRGFMAVVDPRAQFYPIGLPGWGISPAKTLVLRPTNPRETSWAIEQCLRCPEVSVTMAFLDQKLPARVHRRWQLAAEVGGGVGMFLRPIQAQREPIWADLRMLVTPQAGGREERRRVHLDVLYRRGGLGGGRQVWEIDHAAGSVHLVSEMADPAIVERAARA